MFKVRRAQTMETEDKEQQEISKKLDPTNPKDFLEYI